MCCHVGEEEMCDCSVYASVCVCVRVCVCGLSVQCFI